MADFDYDLFVIGGGSAGVRAARLAGSLGKKVAVAEEYRYGGTCVIRGCVPKKLFVYSSHFSEYFEDAPGYGWHVDNTSFSWLTLIANKDKEIDRLEGIYRSVLGKADVEIIDSRAVFVDRHRLRLEATGKTVTARDILIAVGGRPNPHAALQGHELCITSDQAFHLKELPKSIMIAGGGYIAVEFANIFHGLGVETTMIYRGREILQRFDNDLRHMLHETMERKGIRILLTDVFDRIEKRADGRLDAHTAAGKHFVVDQVMLALGRMPNTKGLGLEAAGVETDHRGFVGVDDYSKTSVDNIYALGDVTDRVQLTPVAIHEAMCLIETLYKNNPTAPDLDLIATAVFSQPELGTVGLSEEEAAKKFPSLDVYRSVFRPMKNILPNRDEKMMMKIIVNSADQKVVGVHILGPDAGEMAQLLGISLKAGVTKDIFDRTMAVHPTAAEELVTMYTPTYRVENCVQVDLDGKPIVAKAS